MGSRSGLTEQIKWNALSISLGGDDRITLGIERKGGVRVVLHRGAKQKDAAGFHFSHPASFARWPTVDRGVIVFKGAAQVERLRDEFCDLCARWLAATAK